MKSKPTLALLTGSEARDAETLARLHRKLTGRDPTPDEIADAKRKLAAHAMTREPPKRAGKGAKAEEPRDWFPVLAALAAFDATGETRALADALGDETPDAIPEAVRLVIADTFIRRVQHPRKRGRPDAILRDNPELRRAVVYAFAAEYARLAVAAAERKAQGRPPEGDAEGRTLREIAADAVLDRKPFSYVPLKRSAILRAVAAEKARNK